MKGHEWVAGPQWLAEDTPLKSRVTELFQAIYDSDFSGELMVNHALPVEVRAVRDIEGWRVCLLLTPWMLSRLYLRCEAPSIPVPPEWSVQSRAQQAYLAVGPGVTFDLLGQRQKAHLNYHPQLGHYLIQPLIMTMEPYRSAREVYETWNGVIERRTANIAKRKLECQWQREVSRREFFAGTARG